MGNREENYSPQRLPHSNRGRPGFRTSHASRARPGYCTRGYSHLGGVRDLREIIERRKSEREINETASSDAWKESVHRNEHQHVEPLTRNFTKQHRSPTSKKDSPHKQQNNKQDIKNPLNIKVAFSTSTGEHSYQLDESTVLPTIKHVPDYISKPNSSFRGRGRGRGYKSYKHRNNVQQDNKNISDNIEKQSNEEEENWDNELTDTKEVIGNEDLAVETNKIQETTGEDDSLEQQVENLTLQENNTTQKDDEKEIKEQNQ